MSFFGGDPLVFVEGVTIDVTDFGTKFAGGDNSASAVIKVDMSGGHGTDALGGGEDRFDAEGT